MRYLLLPLSLLASWMPLAHSGDQPPSQAAENRPAIATDRVGYGLSSSIDFIWWRPTENLTSYSHVVTQSQILGVGIDTAGYPKGHNTSIHYQWSPGFTVRFGVDARYDNWDVFADWTWYYNNTTNGRSAKAESALDTGSGLIGTENGLGIYGPWLGQWLPSDAGLMLSDVPVQPVSPGPFAHAHMQWILHYDTVNVEIGKSFKSRYNWLRPFFGIRALTMTRTVKAKYEEYANLGSLFTSVPNYFGLDRAQFKTKMDFSGLGPCVGIFDALKLPCNFQLKGQLSLALLYGKGWQSEKLSLTNLAQGSPHLFQGSQFRDEGSWGPATNIQMRLGLDWTAHLCRNTKELVLGAAWDQNMWFLHQWSTSIHRGSAELGLGGVTLTMQFNY